MKIKNVNLKWYVLRHDFNADRIINYNCLWNDLPEEISTEIKKKNINNKEELKEYLKHKFMYYYWSKAEYEILVSGLHSKEDNIEKIDIWRQIEPNLDRITEYIIQEMKIDL